MPNSNKKRNKGEAGSWDHLRETPPQPQGPDKPWSEDLEQAAEEFVGFLKNSDSKQAVKDYIIDAYKKFEAQKLAQVQSKFEPVIAPTSRSTGPFHQSGNIEPVLHDELNMVETEQAFVRSIKTTKNNLVRTLEDRVEDINRLLADVGGFSAQVKSSFARSTVVFLEQEDPKYSFRERLFFSINLPNYELKKAWDHGEDGEPRVRHRTSRTSLQITWDDAVNALARIVEKTGLKPKYCKNDRHYGRFVMKQDLRSAVNIPDEYFSFTLDYNTDEKIAEMWGPYDKTVADYNHKIKSLAAKIKKYAEDSKSARLVALKKEHLHLSQDRDFFVGTTPDPHQLDEGLLFLIEVSTLKDYHIVKDRMQSIMTRYILFLSKIAADEAKHDQDLEQHLSKNEREMAHDEDVPPPFPGESPRVSLRSVPELTSAEIDELPEYSVPESSLAARRPVVPPPFRPGNVIDFPKQRNKTKPHAAKKKKAA
jgi:hypothetical protein